jgi:hypothetical protein
LPLLGVVNDILPSPSPSSPPSPPSSWTVQFIDENENENDVELSGSGAVVWQLPPRLGAGLNCRSKPLQPRTVCPTPAGREEEAASRRKDRPAARQPSLPM